MTGLKYGPKGQRPSLGGGGYANKTSGTSTPDASVAQDVARLPDGPVPAGLLISALQHYKRQFDSLREAGDMEAAERVLRAAASVRLRLTLAARQGGSGAGSRPLRPDTLVPELKSGGMQTNMASTSAENTLSEKRDNGAYKPDQTARLSVRAGMHFVYE
ncbi:hypothetical protein HK405_005728 [Cladochytrium tenue]|nr:hypothetical protein HK405_005728 [Cladochytrium tenue]